MRRPVDFLRRALWARDGGLPLQKSPRYRNWRAGSLLLAVTLCASATAGEPGPAASRTDLTPKDQARVLAVTRPTADFSKPEPFELMQGGAGTSEKDVNRDAFSQSSANITFEEEGTFKLGNALFRKNWVSSPSSTQASDGLGPLFNERACQNCHLKDGRGRPPESGTGSTSMFLRLARDASNADEKAPLADHKALNFPDPVYGSQLQDLAVPGLKGEGRMRIVYTEEKVKLAGGAVVSLRKPGYSVED
ncbi:MAG: thiol oxidoreductase, partial [Mesorhizobium sp.]